MQTFVFTTAAGKARHNWRGAALGLVSPMGVGGGILVSPKVHRGGIR
ncbi:MAG: hypothetical protein HYZ17_12390 [Betaproteobacteria bacterium]|nr:hypothetical protein [Betaproteobacteria bacterium]